jgi:adenine-specific DNA-methyltransferase
MDGKSLNITEEKLHRLKEIIPEAFTENKIDWEKLKATLSDDIEFKNERYVLNWAGKSDAFRALQSPSTATLAPCREESIDFDKTGNIFIEGENLEVLKVLQKSYFGKVKMIYIDPPYNTGNDNFIYPDKFSETKEEYLSRNGDKDETGFMTREGLFRRNSKDSGHYHSNWLSMMYPRLFLARNLLRDDGVIFVSIDDNEVHNLRLLMNEVFGEENFIECIIWKRRATPPNDRIIGKSHEYVLVYAKNIDELIIYLQPRDEESIKRYSNPDNDPKGPWVASDLSANGKGDRLVESCIFPIVNPDNQKDYWPPENKCWLYNQEKVKQYINENRIGFRGRTGTPFIKRYLSEVRKGITLATLIDDGGFSQDSAKEIKTLFNADVIEFPKPTLLLKKLINCGANQSDIILDFFAGSASRHCKEDTPL